jgi:hypothetical protein
MELEFQFRGATLSKWRKENSRSPWRFHSLRPHRFKSPISLDTVFLILIIYVCCMSQFIQSRTSQSLKQKHMYWYKRLIIQFILLRVFGSPLL